MRTLERLGIDAGYNTLYVTVKTDPAAGADTEDQAYRERVHDAVTDRLEAGNYHVARFDNYITRPGKHWAYDFFSALVMALGGVVVPALFLSALLISNTVMALLAQETRQTSMMKAVGAQGNQVGGVYMSMIAL